MKYRNYYCSPKYSDGDKSYYGNVEGAPEIPMIEAGTVDDFERLFHQAVDDYLDRRRPTRGARWGLLATVLVIAGIAATMILTCPKKEQHVAALQDNLTYILSDAPNSDDDSRALGIMLLGGLAKPVLNTYLSVDDYLLFSVGRWKYDGKEKLASIGAFGHIFTASKKELKRRVEQNEDLRKMLERL